MDFRDFEKAVKGAAREVAPAALAVAPVYKVGVLGVASYYATPAVPFLAVVPADVLMAVGMAPVTGGFSLFLLDPEVRPDHKTPDVDYARLGELAAVAAIQKGK